MVLLPVSPRVIVIQSVTDERMFPAQTAHLRETGLRHVQTRDSTAVFRQAGEIRTNMWSDGAHDQLSPRSSRVNADDIEQVWRGERDQAGVVVLFFNALCELLLFPPLEWISSRRSRPVLTGLLALHAVRGRSLIRSSKPVGFLQARPDS